MKDDLHLPERPVAIRWIAEAVARLTVPPLAPLQQTVLDVRAGVQERRDRLVLEAASVRDDGFAAASRIALSLNEDASPGRPGYFEQFSAGGPQ